MMAHIPAEAVPLFYASCASTGVALVTAAVMVWQAARQRLAFRARVAARVAALRR